MADESSTHTTTEQGWTIDVHKLWKYVEGFEVELLHVRSLMEELQHKPLWLDECSGSLKGFLDHCARVERADLSFPIIVNQQGEVLDGLHRLCKAFMNGERLIRAVRLEL